MDWGDVGCGQSVGVWGLSQGFCGGWLGVVELLAGRVDEVSKPLKTLENCDYFLSITKKIITDILRKINLIIQISLENDEYVIALH